MNIVQIILKLLGSGDIAAKIASTLGISQEQATKGIGAAIPAILAGLANTASKPGGASALANMVSKQDDGILDNIGSLISGGEAASKGSDMLGGLLGGDSLGQLGGVLSKFTGMGSDGSGKLLGLLGPVVMGAIGKQAKGMDAAGIANLLAGQKDNIASALPSGLGSMLSSAIPDLGGMLGSASGAADSAVKTAADLAHDTAREVKAAGSSPMKWLIPLILAGLALLFLPKMCKKAADAGKVISETAGETVAAAADGTKFVSEASEILKTATESVTSITDEASASAAVPKLKELSAKIGGLESMLAKLPDSVQTTVRATLRPMIEKLREAAKPVLSMPIVGAKLQPVFDEIFRGLDKLDPPN